MPWLPDLFNARFISRIEAEHGGRPLGAVPYFDGVFSDEPDALIGSFTRTPELYHPVRGRIRGEAAFRGYLAGTISELRAANHSVEHVDLIVTADRTVEEVVLSTDGAEGRIELPIAIVTDRSRDGIHEIRIYFSTWPMTGEHAVRQPLLQPDPAVHPRDVVGAYQRALAAGDLLATVDAFEPVAAVREPAGTRYTHRGTEELVELYTHFFSNGGGIPLEHCTVTDDGRACAVEYNVTHWGRTILPPGAGVAVYVRGTTGKLSAARIYDDSNPPL